MARLRLVSERAGCCSPTSWGRAATLTFLVISSLSSTRMPLRSITVTFVAGIGIGLVNALVTLIVSISQYRDMTLFVLATIVLVLPARERLAGQVGSR